ncbi:MAG: hypothetical protein WBB01_24920 [Phormidesmis sp.]
MATLLHFLRSLAVSLLTGFVLSLSLLGLLLACLVGLHVSPVAFVTDPGYLQLSRFLTTFGNGDRLEGIIVIALTVGIVFSLLNGFGSYKRSQRSEWHLAMSSFSKE